MCLTKCIYIAIARMSYILIQFQSYWFHFEFVKVIRNIGWTSVIVERLWYLKCWIHWCRRRTEHRFCTLCLFSAYLLLKLFVYRLLVNVFGEMRPNYLLFKLASYESFQGRVGSPFYCHYLWFVRAVYVHVPWCDPVNTHPPVFILFN